MIDHYTRDRGSKSRNLLNYFDYLDMVYPIRGILRRMKPERAVRLTKWLTAVCDPIRRQTSKSLALDRIARRLLPTQPLATTRSFPISIRRIVLRDE